MFIDTRDRFNEFITRNWPTWWQHRLEVPLLGSVGLILLALLIVPIFESVGVSAVRYYSHARDVAKKVDQGIKIRSKKNEPGCDEECKKKHDAELTEFLKGVPSRISYYLGAETRLPVLLKGHIVSMEGNEIGGSIIDGITVRETQQNAAQLSLSVFLVLLTVAGMLAALWTALVGKSLNLREAPATRNQPYVALLFFVGATLTIGPYLAGSVLEREFIEPLQRIEASRAPRFEREAIFLFFVALTCIGICCAYVKLNRLIGFSNTIEGTATVFGIVIGTLFVLAWTATVELIGAVSIATYIGCIAAIAWKGADIHERAAAICLAIIFYFSTLLGPFAVLVWVGHLRRVEPLHEVRDLVPLVVASLILMLISSYVADRASHLPR